MRGKARHEDGRRVRTARGAARAALIAGLVLWLASGRLPAGESLIEARVDSRGFIIGFVDFHWQTQAMPVAWRIHRDGIVNNTSNGNTTPVSIEEAIATLEQAFSQWNAIPESSAEAVFDRDCLLTGLHPGIECLDGKTSTGLTGLDGENVMTWADPSAEAAGAIAITQLFTLQGDLVLTSANRDLDGDGNVDLSPLVYPDGTLLPAGTIVDADISFNAGMFDWRPVPTPDLLVVDLLGIGLHEEGHWFGFAHSPLIEPPAVMFPLADLRSLERAERMRALTADDRASAMRLYALEPAHAAGFGAVTGRLVTASGAPVSAEPVTAIGPASLDMVAFGFSAHPLRESSAGGGTFTIVGLPPGDYLIQAGSLDGTHEHLNRARYSLMTALTNPGGHRPAFVVDPGLESAADDLLPARRVQVPNLAAGGPVDLGDIVVNTVAPDVTPLAGAVPLRFDDNEAVRVDFPESSPFPFYGIGYRHMFVYDNGYVTFTNAASPVPDPIPIRVVGTQFADESLQEFLTHSPKIGALFRNHDPSADNKGQSTGPIDVYLDMTSERTRLTWAAVPEVFLSSNLQDRPVRADSFTLNLFVDGAIEMLFGSLSTPYGTVGITPGGAGAVARFADLSEASFLQAEPLEAIVEETSMGRLDFTLGIRRFFAGLDLSGGRLLFVPGPGFAYAVSRPDLRPPEVSPPGSAAPLVATGTAPTLLTWEPLQATYNLYRGLLSVLAATGTYTPDAGSCLDTSLSTPQFMDPETPPSEDGYYYLVSAEIGGLEGTLGSDSAGSERPNATPCP